ncbi:MAG: hypothetical protein V3R76_11350 [Gammaproteobacteria bacterium]
MRKLCGLMAASLLMISNAYALEVGVGVKAGTIGAGIDLSMALTRTINLRASLTSIEIDDETDTFVVGDATDQGTIDATLNLDFGSSALLFDWYVFNGTFHITAGVLKNNGKIGFSGVLLDSADFGAITLTPADLVGGAISGSISAGESYEPYLGIGWGRKAGNDAGISLSVEIGVALLDPVADLNATLQGINLTQSEFDTAITEAENDLTQELDQLEAWPIISIGFNYAF